MSIFSENTVADEILAPKFLFNLPELEKCCNEQQQEELQSFTEDDLFSHSETSFKDKECNNNKLVVDHQSTDQSKLNNLITESFGTSDMKIPNCSQKVNNNSQNLIIELPEASDINLKKSNENDEIKIPKCGQEFSTELGSDKKEIEFCDDIIEIPEYVLLSGSQEILNTDPEQNVIQNNSQVDDTNKAIKICADMMQIPEHVLLNGIQEIPNTEPEQNVIQNNSQVDDNNKAIEVYDDIIEIPKYCFLNSNEEILKNNDKNYHDDVEVRQQIMLNSRVDAKDSNFEPKLEENPNSFVTKNQNKFVTQNNTNLDLNIKMLEEIKLQIEMQFNDSAKIKIINEIIESMKTKIIKDASNTMNDRNGRTPDPKLRSDEQKTVLDIDPNQQNVACEIKNFQNNCLASTSDTPFEIKIEEQTNVRSYQQSLNESKNEFEILKEFMTIGNDTTKNTIISKQESNIPWWEDTPIKNNQFTPTSIEKNIIQEPIIEVTNSEQSTNAVENMSPTLFVAKIEEQANLITNTDFQDKKHQKVKDRTIQLYQQPFNQSKSEFEILKEFENSDLIKNGFKFFCPACGTEVQRFQGIILKECGHTFCYGCLIDYVKNNGGAGELLCPINEDCFVLPQCDGFVLPQEINSLLSISLKIGNNVKKNTRVSKQERDTPRRQKTSIEKKQFISTLNEENIILEQIIDIINSEQNTNIVIDKNKTNYEILIDLEKTSLVPNQFICDCSLCKNEIEYLNGVVLKKCLHCFCFNCLIHYVSNNNNIGCIPCPFEHDDVQCESFLQPEEKKAVQILSSKTVIKSIFKEQPEVGLAHIPEKKYLVSANKNEPEQEDDIAQITLKQTKAHPTIKNEIIDDKNKQEPKRGLILNMLGDTTTDSINRNELKTTAQILLKKVLEETKSHPTIKNEIIKNNQENQHTKSIRMNSVTYCADYKYLLELEEVDLILTTDKFKCAICFEEINPGKGVRIKCCLHEFCQRCLIDTINFTEDPTIVNCPFFDNNYKCDGTLLQREIKELLSTSDFMMYLKKNIKTAELGTKNSFHCLTPNCENWWIIEENTSKATCDICNFENCFKCKQIHSGLSCEQYSDKLLASDNKAQEQKSSKVISDMILQKNAMICPSCKNVVQKVIGCDAITCKCKTELCWATKGPRWGPKGKGDISGGCRCTANKPCTPTCNYCH